MQKVLKSKLSIRSKIGFTLIEMMLVIAILMITVGAFFSLIVVIKSGYVRAAAMNDLVDYASLNARAIDNKLINAQAIGTGSSAIKSVNGQLCDESGRAIINYNQYETNGTNGDQVKWRTETIFSVNAAGLVSYTIKVYDNYDNSNVYTLSGSVWVPHCDSVTACSNADSIAYEV